jgi:hypothetical protein
MKYRIFSSVFAALLGLVGAPAWGQDKITYYDHATKKDITATGLIQTEAPGQIVIKPATGVGTKTIPVLDIKDVEYTVPALIKPDYRIAINREDSAEKETKEDQRKKFLAESLAKYQEILTKVADDKAKAHFEFKVAKLLARQAQDDPSGVDAAIEKLTQFKKAHGKSWQLGQAVDLLAQLQIGKNAWAAAQKTYEEFEATPDLPLEMKQDCNLKIAQVMVKNGHYADAEKRIQELVKAVPPATPQGIRLQISLAECQAAAASPEKPEKAETAAKNLEGLLPTITDRDLTASAYNTLGFCHAKAQRSKEALWDYLWVDVVYNQNRQEHAKALYHLVKLFKERKEEKRAQEFKAKLLDKQFAGIDYQKMISSEK